VRTAPGHRPAVPTSGNPGRFRLPGLAARRARQEARQQASRQTLQELWPQAGSEAGPQTSPESWPQSWPETEQQSRQQTWRQARTQARTRARSGAGGPGTVSFHLVAGELVVLTGYLTVGAMLDQNMLFQALTGGIRLWLVALWVSTVLLLAAGGAYRQRLSLSVWEELPLLAWRLALPLVALAGLADRVSGPYARNSLALLGTAGAASHLIARVGVCGLIRQSRKDRGEIGRTLVVGGGTVSGKAVELLAQHREYGLLVLGYVDDAQAPVSAGPDGWTYLGPVEQLPEVVRRLRIQTVLVGFGCGSDALIAHALRPLPTGTVQVFAVPRLFELGRRPLGQDHAGPIPLTRIRRAVRRGPRWALKRGLDVVLAGLALLLVSPVLALVAAAVRLECGPGPVVVGHLRVGRHGEPLKLWRFRTARPDRGPGLVGRLLRGSWLGGLPSLWNVLVGDLSVVGPRPATPEAARRLQQMLPHYEQRLQVRGGLVGPEVAADGAGRTPSDESVLYDTAYVENWGLWTDVTVLRHGVRRMWARPSAGE
jgi:lipopolysaccharide/colanic/teichoic acid biosynthesis glycosyltransferase